MPIDSTPFLVPPGKAVALSRWPTRVKPFYADKADYQKTLARHVGRMAERQNLLYAHDRYALLLIFQAMDAAGKDGIIKHVMSGVNPQGCQVTSFKHPSAQELDHDFLWRTTQWLPERGRIGIFNRSYYEEVLIVKVHPEVLAGENLPDKTRENSHLWPHRYESINDLERHLHRNGTRILKFFLHLSKEEQRQRFLARLDDPQKNWKFSKADIEERGRWDDYQRAYEDCLSATSTAAAPWYVVPADDKENARLIVSQVIVETLDALDMHYPPSTLSAEDIQAVRRQLAG
ncbi:polyphosphate kinase 2 family protein [Ideonella sp. B7]|uniref:ADP-polyphosphate phosphotransferase n=1 Tax=Ideonella benzenivorans TaxID=2831643 RepID=UPI001CECA634|nr:ADP-polyphosphate phosphotransferase [Ideonella benzenivorans]MCA6217093.1 polyphosphate kinase 2 family protein [Ideonella benzenivorans]